MPMSLPRNSNMRRCSGELDEGLRMNLSRFSPTPMVCMACWRFGHGTNRGSTSSGCCCSWSDCCSPVDVDVEVGVEVLSLPGSMASSGCSSEHSCEIVSWYGPTRREAWNV
jgi:hypothetical protein